MSTLSYIGETIAVALVVIALLFFLWFLASGR
jgi:nitrogen fixation-related uncharacterized protein